MIVILSEYSVLSSTTYVIDEPFLPSCFFVIVVCFCVDGDIDVAILVVIVFVEVHVHAAVAVVTSKLV